MTETKLNGLTIHNIDSKDTYDALVAAGEIGENDLALVKEDASAFNLGLTGAAVGDIIKVKAVDADGKPTEWEAAELPSVGENEWTLIADVTLTESVSKVTFTELPDGTPFSFRQLMIYGGAVCGGSTARGINVVQGDTTLQQIPNAVFKTGSDTTEKRFFTEINVENGVVWGLSAVHESSSQMMSGGAAKYVTCKDYDQPIESVTVEIATTADTLSAGTWFRIFGR